MRKAHQKHFNMKFILLFLLLPVIITAQINPGFVFKSDLGYNRVDYKDYGLFGFESKDKFGYMDKTGKIIKEPVLYTITTFEKDRALGRLGKTFTIIKSPLLK